MTTKMMMSYQRTMTALTMTVTIKKERMGDKKHPLEGPIVQVKRIHVSAAFCYDAFSLVYSLKNKIAFKQNFTFFVNSKCFCP